MFPHNAASVAAHAVYSAGPWISLYSDALRPVPAHWTQHRVALASAVVPLKRRLPEAVLKQIEDHVADELDGKLTVSSLAILAHLSPCYFARLFKLTVGKTVHGYVLEQRLRQSHDLLLSTAMPLEQIANDLGFADESHFVRRFKGLFGVTPGSLRKRPR